MTHPPHSNRLLSLDLAVIAECLGLSWYFRIKIKSFIEHLQISQCLSVSDEMTNCCTIIIRRCLLWSPSQFSLTPDTLNMSSTSLWVTLTPTLITMTSSSGRSVLSISRYLLSLLGASHSAYLTTSPAAALVWPLPSPAQYYRLRRLLTELTAGHSEEDLSRVMEAAEAVIGRNIIEAVTNNISSLSSSRSRDNLKVGNTFWLSGSQQLTFSAGNWGQGGERILRVMTPASALSRCEPRPSQNEVQESVACVQIRGFWTEA